MQFGKSVVANYLGRAWISFLGFVFLPYYVSVLGPEAFGLVGIFALLQSWTALLDVGMTPTLTRATSRLRSGQSSIEETRNLLRSFETVVFFLCCTVSIAIYAGADWLGNNWLRSETLSVSVIAQSIAIMGFLVSVQFAHGIYQGCYFGLQRQIEFNLLTAIMSTLRHVGAFFVLAFLSQSIVSFFLWQVFVSVLSLCLTGGILYALLPSSSTRGKFSFHAIQGVWRFAASISAIGFLAILLTQADKIILSKMLPLKDFGYYSLSASLAGALLMIAVPLSQAVLPRLIELVSKGDTLGFVKVYHQGAQLMSALMAPWALLIVLYAAEIVFLWSGDLGLAGNTRYLIQALVLGTFLNCLMWIPYQGMVANDWTSLSLVANVVAVILLFPSIIVVTLYFGAIGAAWIWVTLNVGYLTVTIHFLHKRILIEEKFRWYINDVLKQVAISLAVAVIAYPAIQVVQNSRLGLAIVLGVTGCLSTLAAILFSADLRDPVRNFAKSFGFGTIQAPSENR